MSVRTIARLARRSAVAVAAVTFVGTAAAAQSYPGTLSYAGQSTSATFGGYGIGAGTATLTSPYAPGQSFALTTFCVDYLNTITAGATYSVYATSLGTLLNPAQTTEKTRHPGQLRDYKKAAFLTDQFAMFSGGNRDAVWSGIQSAIWNLLGNAALAPDIAGNATSNTTTAYWLNQAETFATSSSYTSYDYNRFVILTDTRAIGRSDDSFNQELLGVTGPAAVVPEPGSVVLLGMGLLVTGGAAMRRRRAVSA